jgi:hypothetical protein
MDELVKARRDNWKKRCITIVNSTTNPDVIISNVLAEYLYYTSDMREYCDRLKNILHSMGYLTSSLVLTRKNEFNKEWMTSLFTLIQESRKDLNNLRKKLRKLKGYELKTP